MFFLSEQLTSKVDIMQIRKTTKGRKIKFFLPGLGIFFTDVENVYFLNVIFKLNPVTYSNNSNFAQNRHKSSERTLITALKFVPLAAEQSFSTPLFHIVLMVPKYVCEI